MGDEVYIKTHIQSINLLFLSQSQTHIQVCFVILLPLLKHTESPLRTTSAQPPALYLRRRLWPGKLPVVGQRENLPTSASSLNNDKSLFDQHDCSLKDQPNLGKARHRWPMGTSLRASRELLHLSQNRRPGSSRFRAVTSTTTCIFQRQNVSLIQHGQTKVPLIWCQGWYFSLEKSSRVVFIFYHYFFIIFFHEQRIQFPKPATAVI